METNTYLVTLNNGAKEEVYCSDFFRAAALAVKQHRDKNPDAPDNLAMSDIEPVGNCSDIVTVN